MIFLTVPPDSLLGILVHNDVLILGGPSGELTGHNVNRIKFGHNALVESCKVALHFLFIKELKAGIVDDLCYACNTILT